MSAKLCLGTVQFGMHYGINNALGHQPAEAEVFTILDEALAAGISVFDTASAYGTAEELLGRYGLGRRGGLITSKLSPRLEGQTGDVLGELGQSLKRLDVASLDSYMLHRAEDIADDKIMAELLLAKERGLITKIGVSIYSPKDALKAAADARIDAIQVPYNVLDQRLDECDFFELAKKNHKTISARSAFLQGLLLMKPENAEARVRGSGTYVAAFQELAKDAGYKPYEAAMLYSLSHPSIDYVVFGVDTVEQLRDNVALSQRQIEFIPAYKKMYGRFANVSETIIEPHRWNIK